MSSAASIPSTEEASFWVSFFLLFQHLSTYSHRHNAAGLCHLLLSPRCRANAAPLRLLPLRGKLDPEYLLISICHAAVFLFSFTLPFRFYWNFHIFFCFFVRFYNCSCSGCDTLFPSLMLLEHHKEEFEHWSDEDDDDRPPCCRRNRDDYTDSDSFTSEAESEDLERLL